MFKYKILIFIGIKNELRENLFFIFYINNELFGYFECLIKLLMLEVKL